MQAWRSPLNFLNTGPGAAYASSTTLTDITPAPQIVPAQLGPIAIGTMFSVKVAGIFSTTGAPTLQMGVYWGGAAGTALATYPATATGTGAASWSFLVEALLQVRSIGTSGSIWTQGYLDLGTSLTAFSHLPLPYNAAPSAVTVDTTPAGAKTLTVAATWGTSSASNTLTVESCLIEVVQ